MAKMQIITKAVLTVLGIYALVTLLFCQRWFFLSSQQSVLPKILFFAAFAVLTAFIVFFTVFSNDSLARKIAGPGDELNPAAKALWLTASLRLGLVFAGLMLLPDSIPTIVKILKIPFLIRPAVSEMFLFKSLPTVLELPPEAWFRIICDFFKAMLTVYLICGAPVFIRWQLRHCLRNPSNAEQTETPNFSTTNL